MTGTHIDHLAIFGQNHVSEIETSRPYMAGGHRNVDKTWRCLECAASGEFTQRAD